MTKNGTKAFQRAAYEAISNNGLKVVCIDYNVAPTLVKYGRIPADAFSKAEVLETLTGEALDTQNIKDLSAYSVKFAAVGFGSYLIRSGGPALQDQYAEFVGEEYAKQIPLRYYTGAAGGAFRYYMMGKKHYEIGAVNNLLYEACNHHKFCADNPLVNIPFTITVEAIDTLAQDYFKGKITSPQDAMISAFNGAFTGDSIAFMVHLGYIPVMKLKGIIDDYLFGAPIINANEFSLEINGNCYNESGH